MGNGQGRKSAAENNRSMTAEIISRLESSYDYEKDGEWTQEAISDHERRLDKVEALLAELERLVIPGRY